VNLDVSRCYLVSDDSLKLATVNPNRLSFVRLTGCLKVCTYVCVVYICACVACICMCIVPTCVLACLCIFVWAYVHVCVHTVCACVCAYAHVCVHVCVHTNRNPTMCSKIETHCICCKCAV